LEKEVAQVQTQQLSQPTAVDPKRKPRKESQMAIVETSHEETETENEKTENEKTEKGWVLVLERCCYLSSPRFHVFVSLPIVDVFDVVDLLEDCMDSFGFFCSDLLFLISLSCSLHDSLMVCCCML
jgi:hypothetical protein